MTKIEDTIEGLTAEVGKSEQRLKKLRNLKRDTESNLLAENAWMRYVRDRLNKLQQTEPIKNTSTKSVLPNTEDEP